MDQIFPRITLLALAHVLEFSNYHLGQSETKITNFQVQNYTPYHSMQCVAF